MKFLLRAREPVVIWAMPEGPASLLPQPVCQSLNLLVLAHAEKPCIDETP